jgi:hypothetical protein
MSTLNSPDPYARPTEDEIKEAQERGFLSVTITRPSGTVSLIDPKNTVLYEGTEDAAVKSLQQKPAAEPTSAQRARETIRGADLDP